MKNLTIFLLLFLSSTLIAQEDPNEPCGLYGPGTNGTITDCSNGPETYSSSCCSGDAGWFWTINGSIDIFASTFLPFSFSGGTVVSASNSQIVIDWDCPEVCPPTGHVFMELTACGSEWFNPIIRIGCENPPCEPSISECFLLDCGACIGIYVNNKPVILKHTSDEAQLWCFPLGVVGCKTFSCDIRPDSEVDVAMLTVDKPIDAIPEVTLVDLSVLEDLSVSPNLLRSSSQIKVSIPDSNLQTKLQISDLKGNIIVNQLINSNDNLIQLGELSNGMYIVTVYNADYTYTKKIIIQN